MLDSVLAENVMAVHRQKRSGVLTAVGIATTVRMAFQDGDPVAIDLGSDKDRLLADVLLTSHRVTREQHGFLVDALNAGESVANLVSERGWASADELGRSLQSVVEESLISFFGGRVQNVSFAEGAAPDFDYDRRAVRLRIAADVLLKTSSARISEQRLLLAEFGDFSGVYGFHEDSPSTSDLSDAERRLLDLIDGRTTLDQMARQLRESRLSVGRTVHALVAKRVLRRTGAAQSTTQLASAPTSPMTAPVGGAAHESALRAATPTLGNFEPYHGRNIVEEPPRRNRALLVVLLIILAVLGMIGVAVMGYNERQRELARVIDAFNDLLARNEWANAVESIADAKAKAGNDLQAIRRVESLQALLDQAMKREIGLIQTAIEGCDFTQARKRLDTIPEQVPTAEIRQSLTAAERTFREKSNALLAQTEKSLKEHGPTAAVAVIAAHVGHLRERASANEAIERWRISQLESAASPGAPIQRRQAALELVMSANPSARQIEQVDLIRADIARQQARLQEQLQRIAQRIDQGDTDGGLAEVDRLRLRELVAGTPLESNLKVIIGRTDQVRQAASSYRQRLAAALVNFDNGGDLSEVIGAGERQITELGDHGTAALRFLIDLAKDVQATIGNGSPEAQVSALTAISQSRDLGQDLPIALNARIERLRSLESTAAALLDSARAMVRDGQYADAEKLLNDLVHKADLRSTTARQAANIELADLATKIARRAKLQDQLKAALDKGDVAAGSVLAREMGLKYLPLSIDSVPSGAEVWHGQSRIGTTPMILDLTAADRVDYSIELRRDGYETTTTTGGAAEAGWRLLVPLNRAPAQTLDLKVPVTIQPSPAAEGWITGSRSQLVRIAQDGTATVIPFGESAVDDPVYTQAVQDGTTIILPTRNLVAITVDGQLVRRSTLPVATDLPVIVHRSAVIVDRTTVIVAGKDGALAGGNPAAPGVLWQGTPGAPFATAPILVNERVLLARRDGTLESCVADDGSDVRTVRAGNAVVAAWSKGLSVAGATPTDLFLWDGSQLTLDHLPAPVLAAGEDILVTTGLRVLVRSGSTWADQGRIDAPPTFNPSVWVGQAVIVTGHQLRVLGDRGFGITGDGDFLPPLVLGDRLITVTQTGKIRIYTP